MHTATQLLIATLMTSPATDGVRDLCEVVNPETGTPRICAPHRVGAPVYDAEVCCAGGSCLAAVDGLCGVDEQIYYCWLGEVRATGEVDCYFEVPDYCDVFECSGLTVTDPQEGWICCNEGVCWEHQGNDCEIQDIYWCSSGVSNPDGTTTCLDEDA